MPSLPQTSCRIWKHQKSRKYGYGLVHRIIYEYVYGDIPDGYEIHHTCREPLCFNPDHLVAISQEAHFALRKKTHCKQGHPLTPENVYISNSKGRQVRSCKICKTKYCAAYQKANKAKYAAYTRDWISKHPEKREARLAYMKEYHQREKEL